MGDPLTIRKLIERISSGDIRIPAFQRDFVWEPDQVAFLLDSIYKGFPIGTIILWKTDTRLTTEKDLGRFVLPQPLKDYPVNYVLDGQQRITSLFSVFQTTLTPVDDEWVDIYFDLEAKESIQESLFVALDESEVDSNRYFPMKVLFDTVGYRKATEKLSDKQKLEIDNLQDRFKEYLIPNETFESQDRNSVAIVFERINRAGTELDIFQLLSAWSWSEDFDLVEKFDELQEEIAEHGYEGLCKDRDLQLRICAGIIRGETTPKAILEMQGQEIRERFEDIRRGMLGAIDFLKGELNIKNYKLLPFPGLIVPLSVFFETCRTEGSPYTDKQKQKMMKWFWRSVFTRRFSAGVNEKQAVDITEFKALKDDENHSFNYPLDEIKVDFKNSKFSSGSADSKTLILLLGSLEPHSFVSGTTIKLERVLNKVNTHEFHHIFPKKHLERSSVEKRKINVLANICFLTRGDNNTIKDEAPSEYIRRIDRRHFNEYIDESLIPRDFADLDYDSFIDQRASLIMAKAKDLMNLYTD
ncbi:MAG: DUF262 domain-containing protein [Candidatus Aenigmarchaeota archaeon]|nr:DUF262 domain-containing protein [Candidatus Aenigmarchaeota archaeon]